MCPVLGTLNLALNMRVCNIPGTQKRSTIVTTDLYHEPYRARFNPGLHFDVHISCVSQLFPQPTDSHIAARTSTYVFESVAVLPLSSKSVINGKMLGFALIRWIRNILHDPKHLIPWELLYYGLLWSCRTSSIYGRD